MKKIKAALRTARALLAKGLLGSDLTEALQETLEVLQPAERAKLAKRLKKEIGILGQIAHDPNIYKNCKVAAIAKKQHPHSHTLIATCRTPMCASCAFNRTGKCSLMGGTLIGSTTDITEKMSNKTAMMLIQDRQLDQQEAVRIASAIIPPSKRVAALHLWRS